MEREKLYLTAEDVVWFILNGESFGVDRDKIAMTINLASLFVDCILDDNSEMEPVSLDRNKKTGAFLDPKAKKRFKYLAKKHLSMLDRLSKK